MIDASNRIEIYTDGACSPNPGPGGYGAIIVQAGERRELHGGFRKTTNNRMEIIAAIVGLKAVDGHTADQIVIYSDSKYLVNMHNDGHARKWRNNGWTLASRKRALNIDLWRELLDLTDVHPVRFEWIKGHSERPENDRCDEMAVNARQLKDLPADEEYEASSANAPSQLSLFDLVGS